MDIGDVVVLKCSENPKMVINEIKPGGEVCCTWYNQFIGRFENQWFNSLALRKCDLDTIYNSCPSSKK